MVEEKPILAYWNGRGIGNNCRLTFAAAGVDFEDKHYNFDENKEEWFE